MTMTNANGHTSDLDLELLHDGELEGSRKRAVEAHLQSCSDCAKKLESMGKLSRMIAVAAEERSANLEFDRFLSKVRQGIEKERTPSPAEALGVWLQEFFSFQKWIWVPSAAAAAAALVAVLWFALPSTQAAGSSQVASVSFASGSGIVFQMEENDGSTTAVVWVNE